jgi:hypothetical protein
MSHVVCGRCMLIPPGALQSSNRAGLAASPRGSSGTPCHHREMDANVSPPGPPVVGLKEAARVCGCSIATVRRRRAALAEHGATQTGAGWTIPIPALVAVGLLDRVTPPDRVLPSETPGTTPPTDTALIAHLRAALLSAEHRAELAEAIAHERGRALAVIEARPLASEPVPVRRSWFHHRA